MDAIIQALAGGALGALVTLISLHVKNKQARQSGGWERFTWAAEALQRDDDGQRAAAETILAALAFDDTVDTAVNRAAQDLLFHARTGRDTASPRERA